MCYIFDKNSGKVLGFAWNDDRSHMIIQLQYPESDPHNDGRQMWNISLDDENPGWMKIRNIWSELYMRDFTKDETFLSGLCKLYMHQRVDQNIHLLAFKAK